MEEKTRNGILSTLSGCGEIVSMGAKRSKLIWTERRRRFPVIIASEVDVLPAEWRQMRQIAGRWFIALAVQVIDRAL
jgi:hypothetical protein